MGARQEHGIVLISNDCHCGCRFCTRSNGRIGVAIDDLADPGGRLPECRTATIMAGDLVNDCVVPIVAALVARGTEEIFIYAHPACRDVMPLKALHDAGATGIHLVLPAADRQTLGLLCGPDATLENVAGLIGAANALDMKIHLEIPVVHQNFQSLPDILGRALKLVKHPSGLGLPFRATHDADGLRKWDFRLAGPFVRKTLEIAAANGVQVMLGGTEGAAPCVLDPAPALPAWYPELDSGTADGQTGRHPLDICDKCAAASACVCTMRGFEPAGEPHLSPVRRPAADNVGQISARPVTAAELFIRRTDVDALLKLAGSTGRCTAPWDSLEAHDRTGRVAPCEGSWPRRDVIGTPDCATREGWLTEGLLKSFNNPSMVRMRRAMVLGGRVASCRPQCPAFTQRWEDRPPTRLPRTRVFFDNLVLSLREFVDGAEWLASRPLNITISPSLRCNQRCRMCDLSDPSAGDMDIDTPDGLFDEVLELLPTTATLAFTGGEPLMSRRAIEIIQGITPATLPDTMVTLTTNGTLLSPAVIAGFMNSSIAAVYISLNAATAESHAQVSGIEGRFTRTVDNARAMIDAARGMPLRPTVNLSFVVMRSSVDELGSFLELAHGLGAGVRLLPVERDRLGESIFTDMDTLAHAEGVARTLRDRYADQWPGAAVELARLHRLIHAKMTAGDTSPI